MDSLKSILDKKNYDLVLSLTEGTADPESLVYRASAFLGKGDAKNARDIFVNNRDALYLFNPLLTLKSNFEIRYILGEFDEAYADLAYFNEKPYASQEVEEYLKALPSLIRQNERNTELAKNYSPEEIKKILSTSKDDYEVLSLLNRLSNVPMDDYISYVEEILVSQRNASVKTFALLLLVSIHYSKSVTFSKDAKVYHLVPKDLEAPFVGESYDNFSNNLSDMAKDPSVYGVAKNLFSDYVLALYPEKAFAGEEDRLTMAALLLLAQEYLRSSLGIAGYLEDYHLKEADVRKKKEEIAAILAKEKPLRL
jgi:uncharacterized protein YeeX (DUF496 family)